jgi:hypothetical protein
MATVEMHAVGACSEASLDTTDKETAHCIVGLHRDSVLGSQFVTIRDTYHPERPALIVAADGELLKRVTAERAPVSSLVGVPIVRAGQTVKLWKYEADMKTEMIGVAEDNGSSGQTIRVRVRSVFDEGRPQEIAGVVRGTASVEMMR